MTTDVLCSIAFPTADAAEKFGATLTAKGRTFRVVAVNGEFVVEVLG